MDTPTQIIFNIVLGVAAFLGGLIVKSLWDAVKELSKADKELTEKVHNLDIHVAENCVTRDEVKNKFDELYVSMKELGHKIDRTTDKIISIVTGNKL